MKLFPRFSIRTYRRRLASFDSVPQFAILGLASGFVTGLVIIAFRLAIEWPLGYLLFDGPESFESLHPLVAFGLPLAGAIILIPIVAIFSDSDRSVAWFTYWKDWLGIKGICRLETRLYNSSPVL